MMERTVVNHIHVARCLLCKEWTAASPTLAVLELAIKIHMQKKHPEEMAKVA